MSPLSRVAPDVNARGDGVAVVQEFSADLYREIAADGGNQACSPYSVAIALAMTRNGARGPRTRWTTSCTPSSTN